MGEDLSIVGGGSVGADAGKGELAEKSDANAEELEVDGHAEIHSHGCNG